MNFFKETVALSLVRNMGPVSFKRLLEHFRTPQRVLGSTQSEFKTVPGISRIDFKDLSSKELLLRAEEEIDKAKKKKVEIVTLFDEKYPETLKNIYDPPILLYIQGEIPKKEIPCVAIVGARLCSPYGERMAREIACDLASAGVSVVSGMALGVDSAAHEGALKVSGKTHAVLGGGLMKIYPSQNEKLAQKISSSGSLISEYPLEMPAIPGHFPVRNRIISGLSKAVVVIEAGPKSGSLITVDTALEQGRDVFAIPGNADSKRSAGSNALLKDGAKLALSASDILSELGLGEAAPQAFKTKRAHLNALEDKIMDLLGGEALHVDELLEKSGLSIQEAMSTLLQLEMKGCVRQLPGKLFTHV